MAPKKTVPPEPKPQTTPPAGSVVSLEEAMAMAYRHWEAGQPAFAEHLCRQVMGVAPAHPDALHLLGLIAHDAGRLDLAVDFLKRASEQPQVPALFHANLTEMLRQAGRLDEGEIAGRRAIARDPNMPAAWNNLGIVLQERGQLIESLDCLKRAAALDPHYVGAQSNLGNTLKKLGRLDAATEAYRQALTLDPNYAVAHSNIAHTLNDLGQVAEARAHAERAIQLDPRATDAYLNLAAIDSRLGQHEAALRQLEIALDFAPDNLRLLLARAKALKALHRTEEAVGVALKAVQAQPGNGEAHETLAVILHAAGQYEASLTAYDRAAALLLEPARAWSGKAITLLEMGRTEAAMAAFDRADAIDPRLVQTWFNRADAKKFSPGDPDIAKMRALFDGNLTYDDRVSLHFALGKALLDSGEDESAFQHLAEGNRLKRAMINYDADYADRWIDEIIGAFPPALLNDRVFSIAASAAPVFVLGMPRSGTTLVEQVLAAHPSIHGAGELSLMQGLVGRVYGPGGGALPYPQFMTMLTPEHFAELGRQYLARLLPLAPGAARIIDKMPANFLYAGLIHLMLPGARIIHCRRDALDTCLSCYTKLFAAEQEFAYDLVELGRFHRAYVRLTDHWRRVLPADRFIEVDYADLVDDLETQARRLIGFIGLDWDEACLSFHTLDRPVKTASMNQVRQPIYRSSNGRAQRYRGYLGPLIDALG